MLVFFSKISAHAITPKVNAYIVNLLKKFGTVSDEIDRADWFGANSPLSEDDFADSYANPKGGI